MTEPRDGNIYALVRASHCRTTALKHHHSNNNNNKKQLLYTQDQYCSLPGVTTCISPPAKSQDPRVCPQALAGRKLTDALARQVRVVLRTARVEHHDG